MTQKKIKRINGGKGGGDNDQIITQVSLAAEHARASVMGAVTAEIAMLEATLESLGMTHASYPIVLQSLAAIKADTMSKAWLAFFEVYRKYGIVPMPAVEQEGKPPDSRARTSVAPEREKESREADPACGVRWQELSAGYDPASRSCP